MVFPDVEACDLAISQVEDVTDRLVLKPVRLTLQRPALQIRHSDGAPNLRSQVTIPTLNHFNERPSERCDLKSVFENGCALRIVHAPTWREGMSWDLRSLPRQCRIGVESS